MYYLKKLWKGFNWVLDVVEPYSDMFDEEVLFIYDHFMMAPELLAWWCCRDEKLSHFEKDWFTAQEMMKIHKQIQNKWYGYVRVQEFSDYFFYFSFRKDWHNMNKLCENYHHMMARDMSILDWCFPRLDTLLYLEKSKTRNYVRNGYMSTDSWCPQKLDLRHVWKIEPYDFPDPEPTVLLKFEDLSLYLKRICWQLTNCIDTPRSPWNLEDHGHFTEANPCGSNWVTYCERMNHQDSIYLNVLPYYEYTVKVTLYDYSIALEFYDKVDFSMVQMVFIMA